MPVLRNCCVFIDLKVGTKIIGVICLLSSLMNTLMWAIMCVMISFVSAGANVGNDIIQSQPSNAGAGGGSSFSFGADDDDEYTDVAGDKFKADNADAMKDIMDVFTKSMDTVKVVCFCLLTYSLLLLIVASMLIHGIRRNRRGLLAPWIILECGKTLIFLIGAITLFAIFGGNEIIVYTGLSMFAAVGLEIYFILVVVSQYQALGIIRMHDEIAIDMK